VDSKLELVNMGHVILYADRPSKDEQLYWDNFSKKKKRTWSAVESWNQNFVLSR
jgi:hypothetical protein